MRRILSVVFLWLTLPGTASAASYNIIDLGGLATFGANARGINSSGYVTGGSTLSSGSEDAYFYDGTMHDLGAAGGSSSQGFGISNNDLIAGELGTSGGTRAFLYDGSIHNLGTLGGTDSYGRGVNSTGWVVGRSILTGNSQVHAFLFDTAMHDIGTLGGHNSSATAINDAGQVTGSADRSVGGFHAFLYDGVMRDLALWPATAATDSQ